MEAVDRIAAGTAPCVQQPAEGATYDKMWKKKELAEIKWDKPAWGLHNFIRGNDKVWHDIACLDRLQCVPHWEHSAES